MVSKGSLSPTDYLKELCILCTYFIKKKFSTTTKKTLKSWKLKR